MSLAKLKNPPWTDSRITAAVAKRLEKKHPNNWVRFRPTARYVSGRNYEYIIHQVGTPWKISIYRGGKLPEVLQGTWMSFKDCEEALCSYLRKTDKFNKAIYPNSPFVLKVANEQSNNQ